MSTLLRGTTHIEEVSKLSISNLDLELKGYKAEKAYFLIEITDRDFMEFEGQVQDTIIFLSKNITALKDLRSSIESLTWYIDFGYNPKVATGELAVESVALPFELLKLCTDLNISINISLYDSQLFDSE